MKKTPLLITVGVVLLMVAGYFLYEKVLSKEPLQTWDLVPVDAIVVYEKNACHSCVDLVHKTSLWKIIERIVLYKKPIDSLQNKINALLRDRNGFLISAHVTKKDEFDFVYYLPKEDVVNTLQILKSGKYNYSSREFNSIQIQEIRFSNQVFSYAFIENVWIGSFTPFLIEDVVRTHKSNTTSFKKIALTHQGYSSIQDDAGNLHIQLAKVSELLSVFSSDQSILPYSLGKSTTLDIKTVENGLVLNGFSVDSVDHSNYMLSLFRHQSPVVFGLKHLIPNRALAVNSYGISDGAAFSNDMKTFVSKRNPALRDTLMKLSNDNKFDLENLYSYIGDEMSLCFFESSKGKSVSKILILETRNPQKWLATFNKMAAKLSVDTIFYERYAQYEIREVPVYKFPEKLFWPLVTGFKQSYYTSIGNNAVVISESLEELKNFLEDIEAEDTWGRSVAQNKFLESTLLESNLSLYINPSRSLNLISQQLQPRWKYFVADNFALLKSLQMFSIQFSHLNNSYYTNALVTFKPFVSSGNTPEALPNRIVTTFDRGILNIHAVRSHVNRSNEILLQDSLNDLSLISTEGKVLWKMPVGDRIVSEVTQVDFYNNGKLQYLFATASAIHIIDRLGNYVDPYPMHLPSVEIEYLSLVDYDNSKKYRIMVADRKGRIWMYDKEGKSLEGWQSKDMGGSLAMPPRHYRIKGKDYLIAVRTDGQIFLMNRRGENLKRFPMDSESIPSGDCHLEVGNTLANTYFVIVSRDGFRIKFTVEGKIQSREALPKTSVSSVFSLVNEKFNKDYLILQQDGKQLILSDESGKKVVSGNLSGLKPSDVKFFDFGSGKIFIVLNDKLQGFSYIYDADGNLLTTPPLETTIVEMRPHNSDQVRIYFVQGKSLIIQPL